jgi:hypothetical protein
MALPAIAVVGIASVVAPLVTGAVTWIGTNVPGIKDITGNMAQGTVDWFNKNVTQPGAENAEKNKMVALGSMLNEWGKWVGGAFPWLGDILQKMGQHAMGENAQPDPRDVDTTGLNVANTATMEAYSYSRPPNTGMTPNRPSHVDSFSNAVAGPDQNSLSQQMRFATDGPTTIPLGGPRVAPAPVAPTMNLDELRMDAM